MRISACAKHIRDDHIVCVTIPAQPPVNTYSALALLTAGYPLRLATFKTKLNAFGLSNRSPRQTNLTRDESGDGAFAAD
jgi:hypothetical protein